jgi:hypothetical protein
LAQPVVAIVFRLIGAPLRNLNASVPLPFTLIAGTFHVAFDYWRKIARYGRA